MAKKESNFTNMALTLVVAFNFSLDFWVSYKLIGGFAITLSYIVITVAYLANSGYLQAPPADPAAPEPVVTKD